MDELAEYTATPSLVKGSKLTSPAMYLMFQQITPAPILKMADLTQVNDVVQLEAANEKYLKEKLEKHKLKV